MATVRKIYTIRHLAYNRLLAERKVSGRRVARELAMTAPHWHEISRNKKPVTHKIATMASIYFDVDIDDLFKDVTLTYVWERLRPSFKPIITSNKPTVSGYAKMTRLYAQFLDTAVEHVPSDAYIQIKPDGAIILEGVTYDHKGKPGRLKVRGHIRNCPPAIISEEN
jgi:hypothetical protein